MTTEELASLQPDDPRFFAIVHTIVLKIIRIPFDTEDVVQDIWIYLKEHPDLELTYGMIKFSCLHALRHRKSVSNRDLKYIPPEKMNKQEVLSNEIDIESLLNKAQLSSLERRYIFLKFHLGYTYAQISDSLNIAKWRVKALHKATITRLQLESKS